MTQGDDATGEGRLWGARIAAGPDPAAWALGVSTHVDVRLAAEDIDGSVAHAAELHRIGILDDDEHAAMDAALHRCAELFADGGFPLRDDDEDVHGAIERWLVEELGPLGGKLRAGRSRNDQIAADLRLYLRRRTVETITMVREVQTALCDVAEAHLGWLAPGMTHLQRGQPVLLSHALLSWVWMLERDVGRLQDFAARADESVLGAGAMAGTTLPIDPARTAADLGFARVARNSMDAVASRDLAAEFLAAAAILGVTCSRLGEELVLWASAEFGFGRPGDAFTTGSSIMPQKRNPDTAELVRGKSARLIGDLTAMLTLTKGLPLTYNRDLQEDKEPVFDAVDTLALVLPALAGTVASLQLDRDRLEAAAAGGFSLATDLAEELARRGVPFREAHEVSGRLVRVAEDRGGDLDLLTAEDLAAAHEALASDTEEVVALLDVRRAVERRASSMGTAPASVEVQLAAARAAVTGTTDGGLTVMERRISLVTLGVDDLERAGAFYEALGWEPTDRADGITTFDLLGQTLALYPRTSMADDLGVPLERLRPGGTTLAHNVRVAAEVQPVLDAARAAGAEVMRDAHEVFWGGTTGYFADPEGNLWEVAHNPLSPLASDGRFRWHGFPHAP